MKKINILLLISLLFIVAGCAKKIEIYAPIIINNSDTAGPVKIEIKKAKKPVREIEYTLHIVGTWEKDRACLWNISKQYYGKGELYPIIFVANDNLIIDDDLIYPGWRLLIPKAEFIKGVIR